MTNSALLSCRGRGHSAALQYSFGLTPGALENSTSKLQQKAAQTCPGRVTSRLTSGRQLGGPRGFLLLYPVPPIKGACISLITEVQQRHLLFIQSRGSPHSNHLTQSGWAKAEMVQGRTQTESPRPRAWVRRQVSAMLASLAESDIVRLGAAQGLARFMSTCTISGSTITVDKVSP